MNNRVCGVMLRNPFSTQICCHLTESDTILILIGPGNRIKSCKPVSEMKKTIKNSLELN